MFDRSAKKVYELLQRLNGKIVYVFGNHDRSVKEREYVRKCFYHYSHYLKIKVRDDNKLYKVNDDDVKQSIILSHYPFVEWDGFFKNSWHLYGHVHGTRKIRTKNCFEVSANMIDYIPISYYELKRNIEIKNKLLDMGDFNGNFRR